MRYLVACLMFLALASAQELQVHITKVEGANYYLCTYTVEIEGDQTVYEMTPQRKSMFRAMLIVPSGSAHKFRVGEYTGKWNKKGQLEIQYQDDNGKTKYQRLNVTGQRLP